MRLIDADAFSDFIKKAVFEHGYEVLRICDTLTVADVLNSVCAELDGTGLEGFKNAPTVDAVPVERKSVSGYEGLYEVDNLSRVFSLRTGKQMKQMVNTRGYKTVALTKEGKTKCVFVHRMVAEAFVPNDANFPFVNHKDEDKTNNLPENLEWCTARYNANYGTAIKRRVATLKRNGTSTKGRPSEKRKQIVAIDENGAEIIFENSYEAAEKTGVDRRNIYACCQGKKKRLNGYKFDWVCGAKMDGKDGDGNG